MLLARRDKNKTLTSFVNFVKLRLVKLRLDNFVLLTSLNFVLTTLIVPSLAFSSPTTSFAKKLCKEQPDKFECITIRIPRSNKRQYKDFHELYKDPVTADILMAINRRNTLLWNGHVIAIPKQLSKDIMSYAPFPLIKQWQLPDHFIFVDLNKLAWGAYEPLTNKPGYAKLIKWGPANGGIKICKETGKMNCKTHPGVHEILKLHGANKRSSLYPIECLNKTSCGHSMPYYMVFHKDGTGIHGDKWLVGRNPGHGCVRILIKDARWLNKHFAYVGMKIIVEDY